ncbi:hypothetical protein JCM10212_002786 [Sporobolomyces blumeae]
MSSSSTPYRQPYGAQPTYSTAVGHRFSSKLSMTAQPFVPYGNSFASSSASAHSIPLRPTSSASASTSTSMSPATTPTFESPSPPWMSRRGSYSSSSDTSEDELETPPTSPQVVPLGNASSAPQSTGKGKGKELDIEHLDVLPFSLHEDDGAPTEVVPPSSPNPALVPTSARTEATSQPSALRYPPGIPLPPHLKTSAPAPPASQVPSTPSHAAPARPRPEPSPVSRQQEESQRGRSRWPRLLWSSQLDDQSLDVLRSYHTRVVGRPLPVLRKDMTQHEIRKWSLKMEDAGL